jgi:hypothetical protein
MRNCAAAALPLVDGNTSAMPRFQEHSRYGVVSDSVAYDKWGFAMSRSHAAMRISKVGRAYLLVRCRQCS